MTTYTLTTSNDQIGGNTDNDTLNGTYDGAGTDTFNPGDSLNGGLGIDTLRIDHFLAGAITPPDALWTNLSNIENIVINTTANGAQTITTGTNFQSAFAALGVNLTTATSGAGAIDIAMTTFTGMATLKTISKAGAQTIVTGLGATTVTATSGAGALNIKGVGLSSVVAATIGAGEQTIGDNSGNGANLVQVNAISAGGAQTITSTSTSAVEVEATSTAGKQIITTGSGADIVTASTSSAINTINTGNGNDRVTILDTALGSYTIDGGAGDDTLTGGAGNDSLIGGAGADILDGVAGNSNNGKGKGEMDTLMGGPGPDIYILASNTSIYYDDGDPTTTGITDYAWIVGFNAQQDKDQVQLLGSSDQYRLEESNGDTKLSIKRDSEFDELIAVFQNTTGLNLNSAAFDYQNAPTDLSLSDITVNENVAANTVIGKFSSTDSDTGNTFTYSLVNGAGGTDNSAFTIKDDELQINASPDFENKPSYNIRVQTQDNDGLTFQKQLTITINDVNEAPTDLALSANTVNENVPANTVIATFSSTDPDTGNTFTYSLVNGTGNTDNSAFTIKDDKLQINASPDFEAKSSYNIRVQTKDNGGLTFEKRLTITINDVNETPTDLALSANTVNNEAPANTDIGTFNSTDPDQNDNFAYSLVSGIDGTDNNAFTIDGNTLKIKNSPDFKTKASYQIRVRTTDNGNLTFEKGLTINVNDEIPSRLTNPNDDIFNITGQDDKLTLEVKLTGHNSPLVNELGLFTIDDAQGTINGIAPGAEGYAQAALQRSVVIFSAIANNPNGFDTNNLTRLLQLNSGQNFRFLLVQDGTLDAVRNDPNSIGKLLFSNVSTQKITDLGDNSFSLGWKDASGNSSTDFNDLVVKINQTDQALPLGTNLQGEFQGEVIDLRDVQQSVQAEFNVYREASYNNYVGFYQVTDQNGGIDTNGDGNADVLTGQAGYIQAAVSSRVAGIDLSVSNQGSASFTGTFQPGAIFAPFMIVNARPDALLDNNSSNDPAVYFPFLGANSDNTDHISLLASNTFGFEDLANGGDKDFNDLIIKVNLATTI
ncbi:DUF4114 domain-containing protein [Nostoc sp.]|uniref:DUF4114 domain-containing protein n=1 Tax=Nostoc sp. TaxID=1180 RepID=UPI002FFB82C6